MIPPNFIVADESAPFDVFSKQGYYTVGNKIFNFKFPALVEATKTGLPTSWNFNDEACKKFNWRQRSAISLNQLYLMRAQQLRDKYDYITLSFSGGADSHQILKTFLNNNIKLDEILVDWNIKYVDNILSVSNNTDPSNYYSEWELCIKPTLEWVRLNHPNVKITLIDSTETLEVEDFEDTPLILNSLTTYQSVKRYRKLKNRIIELQNSYKSVAFVVGFGKPMCEIRNNVFYLLFKDFEAWLKTTYNGGQVFDIEYFYWTPDLLDILKEQCHVIFEYLKFKPELQYLFEPVPWKIYKDPARNVKYRKFNRLKNDLTNSLVYPDWDGTLFQADKPESPHNNPQYQWLYSQETPQETQSWFSALRHMRQQLDEKYLSYFEGTTVPNNYISFYSRMYPIGILNR